MNTMISRKWINGLFIIHCSLFISVTLASCADWDDHYEANASVSDTQNATLWENIERNSELSQFAALVKKSGFDQMLNASQTFTVWAPVNGSFDYDAMAAMDKDRLLREFVENHVARNNYIASGSINEPIFMLNEKLMYFEGNGSYSIQDIGLGKMNIGSSNGVLHLVDQFIPFKQNIYESINNEQFALDSLSNYFHSYDVKELNEAKSVKGPTLNGEITYLDSIFDENNDLFQRLGSYINREDSNYTMIMPTNEAWHRARNTIRQYFHYVPSFEFMENTSTNADEKKVTTVNLRDTEYLTDSLTNLLLVCDLFYNNNLYDNKKLSNLQTGERLQCDSLYATTLTKIYSEDAAALFENTRRVEKSNGVVFVTDDSLRMRTWTSWNPELRQEAESSSLLAWSANVAPGSPTSVYVSETNQNPDVPGKVSGYRYLEALASASNANPELDFYLNGVRSTTYNLYAVVVPANIINASREVKPQRMIVYLGYANEEGKNKEVRLKSPVDGGNYFYNDSSKVDTVFLGEFTFPVAYIGTGGSSQNYYPYIRIRSSVTNALDSRYDRNLRIDCLILRPKEFDEFLKEHPGYKYDDGNY